MSLADLVKKQPESQEKNKYTGVCGFQVVGINPTKAEIEAFGGKSKEEPVYKGDKDGVATLRVDIWVKNSLVEYKDADGNVVKAEPIVEKHSIWLEDKIRVTSTDGRQLVNDYNQSTFSKDIATLKANEKMSWFQHEGLREAYVGEAELLNFVFIWMGFGSGDSEKGIPADKLKFPKTISEIIKTENLSEIKDLVKKCKDMGNGIKLLMYVNEKGYQALYGKFPMRKNTKNFTALNKELSGEYGAVKGTYQNSFDFKLFTGVPTVVPTKDTVAASNDLPF
jgi:hypothetical protein